MYALSNSARAHRFSSIASRVAILAVCAMLSLFAATSQASAQTSGAQANNPAAQAALQAMKRAQHTAKATKPPCKGCKASKPVLARVKRPVQVRLPPPPPMRYVPGMEEPLVATGIVRAQENKDLAATIAAFKAAPAKAGPGSDFSDYAKPLLAFIKSHPHSNWDAALWTNIGLGYFHDGYYSRAMDAYAKAWKLGRKATSPQARAMVDHAVGELAAMHARLGHAKQLKALLADIGKRPMAGPATELMQGARDGLWAFKTVPGKAFLCGPMALKNVLLKLKASEKQIKVAEAAKSGPHGFSLAQLSALADKAGLKHTLIFRNKGQPVPVPSIINWKTHHYAAIISQRDGYYTVLDPTFGDPGGTRVTKKAIDSEGSGYFLVPSKVAATHKKSGWRTLSPRSSEIKKVYGMGQSVQSAMGATMSTDVMASNPMPDSPADVTRCPFTCSNAGWGEPKKNSPPQPQPQKGMMTSDAQMMVVGLHLQDTPIGYKPQVGIPQFTTISYNAREAEQPANFSFSNLSPKWSHSWMSYIQDYPGTGHEGQSVTRVQAGGGGFDYPNTGYNTTTGQMPYENDDLSILTRTPATGTATQYTRTLGDGTKEIYALSDGSATYPRKMFLTSIVDPQGNTTTLNYDASFRLTSVTDSMGRSTTFTYGLTSYPLLITEITDAFGRSLQITYDSSLRLSTITDPVGIVSTVTYNDPFEPTFVNSLTTPYGTTDFSDQVNPYDESNLDTRSLMTTDPMGYSNLIYFYQNPNITPASDPDGVPTGLSSNDNGLLEWRNTYYWDKHAFALGVSANACGTPLSEDFSKSKIIHWYHDPNTGSTLTVGREIASIKPPLEKRLWFSYWNQPNSYTGGHPDQPRNVARLLDDGSTQRIQLQQMPYTPWTWVPWQVIDPLNRTTQFNWASNHYDLLTVQQNGTTIGTYGSYNSQHEPQTFTGPDGKTWNYTYTSLGQIATVTDPNSNATTYNYDAQNRLSTIVNANSQTVLTLTYDSEDRVQTRTDSEGYTLTYAYDDLDRLTSITYPDGTTDLFDYDFQSGPYAGTPSMELRKYTDRLGRVTTYDYDADQRLTSVTQPLTATTTRTTSYDYYENGKLKDIIDANGNDTHWDIDVESRPIDKIYDYGTANAETETYTYENSTSRLKSVTDPLGQVKTYSYDKDDELTGITYTNTINPTPNVTFTWDTVYPRITKMTDGTGTTNYSYTAVGTLGALKLSSIAGPYTNDTLGLTYDALGRLAGETISGGNETFGYDAINRLTSHGTPLGTFTNTYLGQTDQITSRSVTNGSITVSTNWGYDTNTNDRRLISITNSGVTRSYTIGYGSTPVNPYDIMSITDTAAPGHPWSTQSHSYTYDYSDRLLSASYTTPGNFAYAYDDLDNATTWTTPGGTTYPTYNGFNQISTWGSNTYSYDADGNLLSGDGVKTYKWDAENRLIEIDYVGSTAKSQFTYNGIGQRVQDVETSGGGGTTTTRYMWCGGFICQTRDGSDTVLRRQMEEGEYNVSTGQMLVYMPDQLWAVRDVVDATTGNLVQSYDYDPYGGVTRSTGSAATDYQFAELFSHPASTLNLSATRAYDSATGKWLSRDLLGEAGGINLYGYVDANTTNKIDPFGMSAAFGFPAPNVPGRGAGGSGAGAAPAGASDNNNYPPIPSSQPPFPDSSSNNMCTANGDENSSQSHANPFHPAGLTVVDCQTAYNTCMASPYRSAAGCYLSLESCESGLTTIFPGGTVGRQ